MTGGELELQEVGLLVGKAELRSAPRAHVRAAADLELEQSLVAGEELVAGHERRVDLGGRPVGGAGTPEGDGTLRVAQARRRGADRVGRGGGRRRRRRAGWRRRLRVADRRGAAEQQHEGQQYRHRPSDHVRFLP